MGLLRELLAVCISSIGGLGLLLAFFVNDAGFPCYEKLEEALEELLSRAQSSLMLMISTPHKSTTAANPRGSPVLDYTLNNPDTLTKYKTAAAISQKVLESVAGACFLAVSLSLAVNKPNRIV